MNRNIKFLVVFGCLFSLVALAADSRQLVDVDLRIHQAERNGLDHFARFVAQADDAWVGFEVDKIPGKQIHGGNSNCTLESDNHHITSDSLNHPDNGRLVVLAHAEAGKVTALRFFSSDCTIDAGGATVFWLTHFGEQNGLEVLSDLVKANGEAANGALAAIAFFASEQAGTQLTQLAGDAGNQDTRQHAIFWLGTNRGEYGLASLMDLAETETNEEIREHITFGLNVSQVPAARDYLMSMARNDLSGGVRTRALFWLAQKGGDDVLALLRQRLEEESADHLEEIVFAVSRLPSGQGTPELEELARNHQSGKVRAGALFWLAQSGGDEAEATILDLLENDDSSEVRERAVFSLTQLSDDRAISGLMKLAETHNDPDIRGKALFWLSQKAGDKVADQLQSSANNDPELEVKEQAVFAISQLPGEKAIPMLTKLAREHEHPEVRKKAMFWLGQSGDERALDVIKEVLDQ